MQRVGDVDPYAAVHVVTRLQRGGALGAEPVRRDGEVVRRGQPLVTRQAAEAAARPMVREAT